MSYPKRKKILLIKLSAIGDVLASSPVFSLLAVNSEVHHLVMSHCRGVTQNNPAIAKHHVIELIPSGNRWLDLWRAFKLTLALRAEKYDLAFVLHRNIAFQTICWLSGIGKIYGFSARWNPFFTRHMPYRFDVNRTLQECELFRLGGFDIQDPTSLEFYPEIKALPENLHLSLPDRFIACNPGGGNPHSPADNRMWPIEHYAELINRSPLPFVILGHGQSDLERVSRLNKLVEPERMINLVGKTSFSETALILQSAALYVGNDSSLMFLGAAMGTKTLGLYGPTQVMAANPIGKKQYAIRGEAPCAPCYNPYLGLNGQMYTCRDNVCMKAIQVEEVFEMMQKILNCGADSA